VKTRRLMCMLMACTLMLIGVITPARAAEAPGEVISLEDLNWEWVDLPAVEYPEEGILPLTSASASRQYAPHSISYVTSFMDFDANDVVTFNCSYSPSSASVDFGVIASSGRFYSVNVKGGKYSAVNQNHPGRKLRGGDQEQFFTNCACGWVRELLTVYVPHNVRKEQNP